MLEWIEIDEVHAPRSTTPTASPGEIGIVIECNDGQESGYAGVSPFVLWKEVVRIERERLSR
jgi:hypothetical protein